MRIIVSDTSYLIDLRKASLLEGFLKLPYEIVIPDTLFEEELLKFSETEKRMPLDGGMKVIGALELFTSDPSIYRFPNRELRAFIKRYVSGN
jgi:hypothetical protein